MGDAGVQCGVDHGGGTVEVDGVAEGHRAEDEAGESSTSFMGGLLARA